MILTKFIKPKWQHRNTEVRKSAVESLNDPAVLSDIAQHDEAATVRQVAVQKLEDLRLLENLAHHDTDPTVRDTAKQRFKKLFCLPKLDGFDLASRLQWIAELTDTDILEYVAQHGHSSELRLAAIGKIDHDSVLGDIAINDPSNVIRVVAVEKLSQPSTLERVFKATRNRDKRVSRIARDQLDAMQEQQEQILRTRNECEAICKRLEALGRTQQWEQELAEFQRLQERWQTTVATLADEECQQRFLKAQQAFQTGYQQYQQQQEDSQQREQQFSAAKDKLCQEADQLLADLQSLERLSESEASPFTQRLQTLQQHWQAIPLLGDTKEALPRDTRFEQICQESQRRLHHLRDTHDLASKLEELYAQAESWLNHTGALQAQSLADLNTRWQAVFQSSHSVTLFQTLNSRFQQAMDELHTRLQQHQEYSEQVSQQLKQLLTAMETALEQGELKVALPLEQQVRDLLKSTEGLSTNLQKKLENRFQKCIAKLSELRGWQSWGNKLEREKLCQQLEELLTGEDDIFIDNLQVTQQVQEAWRRLGAAGYSQDLKERFHTACQAVYGRYRDSLCRQMEKLLETSDAHPEERAQLIREAQAFWKKLGATGHSQELWERFNQACNTAYEPCQQYFKQQAQERQQHLAQKIALCERLEQPAINLDSPNWKEVYQFIRQVENEWKRMGPIDRKARKNLQKRYHKALQPWQTRLEEEQQQNFQSRQQLIAQVQAIVTQLEQDENYLENAISEVKRLQSQWHVTVPGNRREERQLWRNFRQTCDIVFDRRKQQQEAAQQELQTHLDQKVAFCEQVEALAKLTGAAIHDAPTEVRRIQEDYKKIGPVPKKVGEAVDRRFEQACRQVELQRQAQSVAQQRQQLELLSNKAAFCVRLERPNLTEDQIAALTIEWERLPPLHEEELETAITQRFQTATRGQYSPQAETLKAKKIWCIRLEILAGIESPPEEVEARMAYQVARLSEAMSGGEKTVVKDKQAEVQEIERAWYLSGPVSYELADRLEQRFARACGAFYARSYK